MKAFVGSRAIGKTRMLLEHAKEHNAIVVCRNPAAMEVKAHAYGIIGLEFLSYKEFINETINNLSQTMGYQYAVDDVELLLEQLGVVSYSSTIEE